MEKLVKKVQYRGICNVSFNGAFCGAPVLETLSFCDLRPVLETFFNEFSHVTRDFEFLRISNCNGDWNYEFSHVLRTLNFTNFPLYRGLSIFTILLCIGDFVFYEFSHVLRTLSFYKLSLYTGDFAFLRISLCTGDFEFLQLPPCTRDFGVSRAFPCTGGFEFLQTSLLYWRLWILQIFHCTGTLSFYDSPFVLETFLTKI